MQKETRQERIAAVLTPAERQEQENLLLDYQPEWIIPRILAMGAMSWLTAKPRDEKALLERQADRTLVGLNWFATPENPSGKVRFVRITDLVSEIEGRGYVHSHSHVQLQEGKGPVNVIAFRRRDTVVAGVVLEPLHPQTRASLGRLRFNDVGVWGNVCQEPGGRLYRLDAINLAKGLKEPGGRELHFDANAYRLVEPEDDAG